MTNEILSSDELRLRLIDLEYKDLSNAEFIEQVERIYVEETGKELPADIQMIRSSQVEEVNDSVKSAYDGTAIHFYSKENNINQVYVISQGSQGVDDWAYNMQAMFAGKDDSQAKNVPIFIEGASREFEKGNPAANLNNAEVIGLSHSLAHNNNTTARLNNGVFDKIYSVNGAQTNYYQLFFTNRDFRNEVTENFGVSRVNPNEIYSLPPEKLQAFTENYFKEKGLTSSINQLISSDDPLYGVSGTRGFFQVGDVTYVDTNPNYNGIRELVDRIPDKELATIQQLAVQFTDAGKSGGTNTAIQDLTGVDMDLLEGVDSAWAGVKLYFSKGNEVSAMINEMSEKTPQLLTNVKAVTSNSEAIFGALEEANYITIEQKKILVAEMGNIERDLEEMVNVIKGMDAYRDEDLVNEMAKNGGNPLSFQIGADGGSLFKLWQLYGSLTESMEIVKANMGDAMKEIGHSHSILEMLNALSEGREYDGLDLILVAGAAGAAKIKVNISAAVRFYQEGQTLLNEKTEKAANLMASFGKEVTEDFVNQQNKVIKKIEDIEASPANFQSFNSCLFTPSNALLERIDVHEELTPLTGMDITHIQESLASAVETDKKFLQEARGGIEGLFDKDDHVAAMFDFQPGGTK